jgi:2-polyprenyl-3-methyl-5-hydroxy-6-metoxy-1,4-benzoquinol methylase
MNQQRPDPSWQQKLSTAVAESFLMRSGKRLHEENPGDIQLGGSLVNKFLANLYLILADYGRGEFPPQRPPREEAFQGERTQYERIPFSNLDQILDDAMRKPWGDRRLFPQHSRELIRIIESIEQCGIEPPAKLLELGCGGGWLSEILAIRGFDVTGSTIGPSETAYSQKRIEALKVRNLNCALKFIASPMEEIHQHVPAGHYDAAFCYEALHHVFDWRESLTAIDKVIKPGGWLFLFSEPSTLHTYICHRSAKIWRTQEVGFRGRDLRNHLRSLGYDPVKVERPVWGDGLASLFKRFMPFTIIAGSLVSRAYWISARKRG